jgi:hypothetical protein
MTPGSGFTHNQRRQCGEVALLTLATRGSDFLSARNLRGFSLPHRARTTSRPAAELRAIGAGMLEFAGLSSFRVSRGGVPVSYMRRMQPHFDRAGAQAHMTLLKGVRRSARRVTAGVLLLCALNVLLATNFARAVEPTP